VDKHTSNFCNAVHQYVEYWEMQDKRTQKEQLTGLAFSILRLLDGVAPNFEGNIKTIANENPVKMLHHMYRQEFLK
jgi:hypothetical protein